MIVHLTNGNWNYDYKKNWVGGKFPVSNLSEGYHGILTQWFNNRANNSKNCLLISENETVRDQFQKTYPNIKFKTLEFYEEMNENFDLRYNLCEPWQDVNHIEKFDIILCQATFEHLYDPCTAMRNLISVLNQSGTLLIHTHVLHLMLTLDHQLLRITVQ
jgi:SAM-dependent methyltransferase